MKINPKIQMERVSDEGTILLEDRGFSIIPISDSKVPISAWQKYQHEKVTVEEWQAWCEFGAPRTRGGSVLPFGVGIVTGAISGIVVVDCDDAAAIKRCRDNNIWSHIRVKTARGMHLYFKHPNRNVPNAQAICRGVDLRGDGGMVIAPPTVLGADRNNFEYKWDFDPGYSWDDLELLPDLSPIIDGAQIKRSSLPDLSNDDDIDLTDLGIIREGATSVWHELSTLVSLQGKLKEGDKRNLWMYRFICSQLGKNVWADELDESLRLFQDTFFQDHLTDEEINKVRSSAVKRDIQKNRGKYDAGGNMIVKKRSTLREDHVRALPVFRSMKDFSHVKPPECLIHPILWSPHILHFHGHQGAGKSIILMNLLASAALGKDWGPFSVQKKVKTLYVDYDMGAQQIHHRIEGILDALQLSDIPDGFVIASSSQYESGLALNTAAGLEEFKELLVEHQPDVVVIDTVRSAWPGLNENEAAAWSPVNELCRWIKSSGSSVVIVHHSNKPGETTLGREAGSGAQLTLVDMQAQVVQVDGKDEKNLPTDVEELASLEKQVRQRAYATGRIVDDYIYTKLHEKARDRDEIVRLPLVIDFAKNRDGVSDCTRKILALTEHKDSGRPSVVCEPGGMQKAKKLRALDYPIHQMAEETGLPVSELKKMFL